MGPPGMTPPSGEVRVRVPATSANLGPGFDALGLSLSLHDNVAACLAPGLTVAWTADGQPQVVRLEPLPSITPVVCVAPAPVRTDVARGLLPGVVPHKDAAASAGRSALLVAALTRYAEPGVL